MRSRPRLPRGNSLISAIFGPLGRADAAHAALILAGAHGVVDGAVTLVRITLPGEASLPSRTIRPDEIRVVERAVTEPSATAAVVENETRNLAGRHAVLDLPGACLVDPTIHRVIDTAVMTVGPTPFDEHAAAAVLDTYRRSMEMKPQTPWLLGCGRGLAATASVLARAVARSEEAGNHVRVLPLCLPALSRLDAVWIAEGDSTGRTLAAGIALLVALRIAAARPDADAIDPNDFEVELAPALGAARVPDGRDMPDRMRELADELQGIRDGLKPTAEDLKEVPRLEGWSATTREVRILTGCVHGHPDFPDGRRIVTSDLYASDGSTWARTLSRYFKLGKPARRQGAKLH